MSSKRVWHLRGRPAFAALFLLLATGLGLAPAHAARLVPTSCVHALSAADTPVQLDMPGQPELRHVSPSEIPALIIRLQHEFGYGANDAFYAGLPQKYEALAQVIHQPLDQRTDEYWVIVFPDGQIAGGIGLAKLDGYGDDHQWWLEWFYLSPRLRGHKLGEQMIAFIENRARAHGATTLSLYTSSADHEAAANHLYEKRGYKVYKTEPDTLIDGTPVFNLYRARTL